MNVKIKNYCKKNYEFDVSEILTHIMKRIPEKFLIGLSEVRVFDPKEENLYIRYVPQKNGIKQPIIEFYMDNSMLKGASFFSLLFLNVIFISTIIEHIEKYVKLFSKDKEILSINHRIAYEWMYIGKFTFIFVSILKTANYLISRFQICRNIAYYLANQLVKDERHK